MTFEEFKFKYEHIKVKEFKNQTCSFTPMVSICVQTYNHEKYIRQCLDSILMQKTSFPIEILLGEDDSSDNTRQICIDYATSHPNKIRLFKHHRKNNIIINDSATGRFNSRYNFYSARGKYIAICEGDDFWCDNMKLQKQYDYLENYSECSLCFHSSLIVNDKFPNKILIKKPTLIPPDMKFGLKDVIKHGGGFMTTNSMFFRRNHLAHMPEWMFLSPVLDLPLMLFLALQGKLGYIDEVMSAYRVLSENSWSNSLHKNKMKRKSHYSSTTQMWSKFNEYTNKKHNKLIFKKLIYNKYLYYKSLIRHMISEYIKR